MHSPATDIALRGAVDGSSYDEAFDVPPGSPGVELSPKNESGFEPWFVRLDALEPENPVRDSVTWSTCAVPLEKSPRREYGFFCSGIEGKIFADFLAKSVCLSRAPSRS